MAEGTAICSLSIYVLSIFVHLLRTPVRPFLQLVSKVSVVCVPICHVLCAQVHTKASSEYFVQAFFF